MSDKLIFTKDQLPTLEEMSKSKDIKDREMLLDMFENREPGNVMSEWIVSKILLEMVRAKPQPRGNSIRLEFLKNNDLIKLIKINIQFEKEFHEKFKMRV